VAFGDAVLSTGNNDPRVSVIVPAGGRERLSQLMTTLRSLMGQSARDFEIVVAEYGEVSLLADALPSGVRHVFVPSGGGAFNKSLALNRGVDAARGAIMLLHDADVVVPRGYLKSVAEVFDEGWEAVRPVRLLFHLAEEATTAFENALSVPDVLADIQQNNPGISTAVLKTIYVGIGGHDERFEGWGGEDNEFLDRLRTRRLCPAAWLPAIHLWHGPAPKKSSGDRNQTLTREICKSPVEERIARLLSLAGASAEDGIGRKDVRKP
jgi:glycosyltransferase involved in cell wall biosynthesis